MSQNTQTVIIEDEDDETMPEPTMGNCYIYSCDGWSVALRESDNTTISGTGNVLMTLSCVQAELLGYNVVGFDADASDDELEYGCR